MKSDLPMVTLGDRSLGSTIKISSLHLGVLSSDLPTTGFFRWTWEKCPVPSCYIFLLCVLYTSILDSVLAGAERSGAGTK